MAEDPKKKPPLKDPFDIAGAEDRAADYLDKIMNGKAEDEDAWNDGED